jgi:hypothetical protein
LSPSSLVVVSNSAIENSPSNLSAGEKPARQSPASQRMHHQERPGPHTPATENVFR